MLRDKLMPHPPPNAFDAGKLMSFLLYTVMIAGALGGLSDLFSSLMNAVGASDRIFQIFDRVSTIANQGGELLDTYRGVLQLKDVSFAYPTRPDVLVPDRVSLTIQPGTVVALCGPSGWRSPHTASRGSSALGPSSPNPPPPIEASPQARGALQQR